ncbi:rho guanine nucleotide exchange factor 26-like isoform X2 [Coregonus clupeaformis]|uniref:rho guanine nucleotide exchange factor 26-like isoform X2 n=1 Tax=Coregonus clupeaformis TaxID=59861 RepID=UPI001E1C5DB0|nr:rho guanine nucleotide exchange factor 26-like isoform X2 [Coregonus clupeaformis]
MEGGNEVDLSNNNITPLWKRHSANHTGPSKTKARPLSYQIDRLHMTDFPVEDNKCSFTLSQPAERLVAMPGGGMVILKHLLNQPARKTRVVRSISIGHLPKGRFSLSKFKSKDDKSPSLDNKAYHGGSVGKIGNGEKVWSDQTSPSSYHPLNPRPSPPNPSPSPPSLHTPTPSHSSTSSISSLTSTFSPSDPPTPRSPSPADMSAPSPSPTPSLSPPPSIVLSTHSAAALKTGTQQLIPKGLASLSKVSPAGVQSQALGVLLGLNPTKRALRALSMVETGTFFSTDGGSRGGGEGTDQDESPGTLKRGLRSTSYRRAVVSGVEMEVPSVDPKTHRLSQPVVPKTHRLSQPVLKGLQAVKESPTSPGKKNKRPDKKTGLITQRTFDSEEEELYQNYQEKALHNDSDEDQFKEAKPADRIVVQYRPIRTSWSQLSVVKKSGVSDKLSQEERKRQEAIFELISSEHSYLHSLEILIRMFKNSAELSDTMTKTEHHHLFSNITDVCEASKKFFKELEDKHQQNIVIDDISDIVFRHAQSNFDPYITYCSNEVYQQRTLQRLVSKNPVFKEVLTRIEAHPDCRNLPMISFLILPMQRVTRLPLLMDVICQKASKDSAQYEACKKALQSVSKVVRKCNEGARTMERTEMMYTINSQLEFKIKPFPLVSSSRWMVKRGELTAFVEENGIFSKRTSRQQVYFFLFNDVLILTRKKSEDSYAVIDYALRDHIWVGPCQAEDINLSPVRTTAVMLTSRQPGASHLFRLRFRSNHSGDKVPMVLGVELMNERARWISALGQSSNDKKNQDRTNAMQVEVTRTYTAKQPDELSLQVADVVLVSQTVEDGWYEGERLRDGERGWFLSECAEPITCQATIERNMQRMDRLQGLETNV